MLKCFVDIPLIPIVVFNNSAELKVHVSNHIVVNRCNLNWAISQYHDIILNATQVDRIINTIGVIMNNYLAEIVDHITILVTDTVTFEVRIWQLVIIVFRCLHLIVHLRLFCVEKTKEEIPKEQERKIDDGREHVFRLPKVYLVFNAHILLFERCCLFLFLSSSYAV